MDFKQLESKLSNFWMLQWSGWLLYIFVYTFHLILFRDIVILDLIRIVILLAIGFFLTVGMRSIYKFIDISNVNIFLVILTGLTVSFLGANIWVWGLRITWSIINHGFVGWNHYLHPDRVKGAIAPLFFNSILLLSWTALYFTIKFLLNWMQQKEIIRQAREKAQMAQLQMLRYQLNPHFMFNSLNAIRALIKEDKQSAKQMITELSEVLRYALISKADKILPLKHELEALRQYFAIEKRRYEDKLHTFFDIDPAAADYPVISFLLHPIAENAIKHGMKTCTMPLHVMIRAEVTENALLLEVENTGRWIPPEIPLINNCQHGLYNVRQRLATHYHNAFRMSEMEENGRVKVSLELFKQLSPNHAESLQVAHR
ncbi:histidine kinase [bacterium]|nr:histidine kinase [candidate division CSSED10-310 bacterium]